MKAEQLEIKCCSSRIGAGYSKATSKLVLKPFKDWGSMVTVKH